MEGPRALRLVCLLVVAASLLGDAFATCNEKLAEACNSRYYECVDHNFGKVGQCRDGKGTCFCAEVNP